MAGQVSIGIGANAQAAKREIAGLSASVEQLVKGLQQGFSGRAASGARSYSRELRDMSRALDELTQRMRAAARAKADLERQPLLPLGRGGRSGPSPFFSNPPRSGPGLRSLPGLDYGSPGGGWTPRSSGGPSLFGGNRGFWGNQNPAPDGRGDILDGRLVDSAAAAAAVADPAGAPTFLAADLAWKALTAGANGYAIGLGLHEQKALADMLPRARYGTLRANPRGGGHTSGFGFMNEIRPQGAALGFNGFDEIAAAGALLPGTSAGSWGRELPGGTLTAMQLARSSGLPLEMMAGAMGEVGKTGSDMNRWAKQFAREIKQQGFGHRFEEMMNVSIGYQQAQMRAVGRADPTSAAVVMRTLNETGIPGLIGQPGADMMQRANSVVQNTNDGPARAMWQAVFRDQFGITDAYTQQMWLEDGPIVHPAMLPALADESRMLNPDKQNIAWNFKRTVPTMSLRMAQQLVDNKNFNRKHVEAMKPEVAKGLASDALAGYAKEAQEDLLGNQARKGEAGMHNIAARIGTNELRPLATIAKTLGAASVSIQHYMNNTDRMVADLDKIAGIDPKHPMEGNSPMAMAARRAFKAANPGYIAIPVPPHAAGPLALPKATLDAIHGLTGEQRRKVMEEFGRHGDASFTIHHKVSFDHTGQMHPQHEQQFIAMVGRALDSLQRRQVRTGLHHRNPRVIG